MRIALGIEYNGSAYCGWQVQPDERSVQGEVERSLSLIADDPIKVTCAGRTDSGVHAFCQVVHFDTDSDRPINAWVRGANSHLDEDVSILWAKQVGDDFHARFSAVRRSYSYFLINRPQRPGLLANRVGWFHDQLNLSGMLEAANSLLGENDFSAFRAAECQAKSPVRVMDNVSIDQQQDIFRFHFVANAFLHHMIRNIVGALVYVGSGRKPVDWIQILIESKDRSLGAPTFSASGLYLDSVEYGAQWGIPEGASLSRLI